MSAIPHKGNVTRIETRARVRNTVRPLDQRARENEGYRPSLGDADMADFYRRLDVLFYLAATAVVILTVALIAHWFGWH